MRNSQADANAVFRKSIKSVCGHNLWGFLTNYWPTAEGGTESNPFGFPFYGVEAVPPPSGSWLFGRPSEPTLARGLGITFLCSRSRPCLCKSFCLCNHCPWPYNHLGLYIRSALCIHACPFRHPPLSATRHRHVRSLCLRRRHEPRRNRSIGRRRPRL